MCWCDKVYSFVRHHSRLSVIPIVLITFRDPHCVDYLSWSSGVFCEAMTGVWAALVQDGREERKEGGREGRRRDHDRHL